MFSFIKKELVELLMEHHVKAIHSGSTKENDFALKQTSIIMEWALVTNGTFEMKGSEK